MTPDETVFFRQLGTRIAERRKAQDLTQAQLGELVGVAQQQIASFEIGRRRIPVSTLPLLAKALDVSIEALIGGATKTASKRGPAPKLQQQLEQLSRLPKTQQRLVGQPTHRHRAATARRLDKRTSTNNKARNAGLVLHGADK